MNRLLRDFLVNLAQVALFVGCYALFLTVLWHAAAWWGPVWGLLAIILGIAAFKTWADWS